MTARPYISVKRSLPVADTSKPPFKLGPIEVGDPIVTVVNLPFPPSTNSIWKRTSGGISISKDYRIWKEMADKFCLYTGDLRGVKQITGRFTFELVLDIHERNRAGDLDNRIKSAMDFCQSRELIRNDRDCDGLQAYWGDAPHGCKITLRAVLA